MAFRCIVMGAAGRDFHDFNTYWRSDPRFEVVAFTATQIPDIEGRAGTIVLPDLLDARTTGVRSSVEIL